MKKRILSLTSLMLSAVLLFTGCGSAKEDAGTAPAGEGTKQNHRLPILRLIQLPMRIQSFVTEK